jgi:NAD(P)H-hydrate epimerase
MIAIKSGMMLNDGIDVCGKIYEANLGAPVSIVKHLSKINILEEADIKSIIPIRNRRSSKFDYGKVFILAGSKKYPGAAALTANSAIKSGAGLVYLFTPVIHSSLLPEAIPHIVQTLDCDTYHNILSELQKANVVVIGPGLGDDEDTIKFVERLVSELSPNIPIVIDAEGLRFINQSTVLRKNIIITPHCGEFSRITGINRKEIEILSLDYALEYAKKLNCIILLKSVPSIITDGEMSYLNIYGNPGMSSGGTGDVLAGIIAGLLAIGLSPILSASIGAFIHSKAGDYYAQNFSQETLTASSIIESLSKVFPKQFNEFPFQSY